MKRGEEGTKGAGGAETIVLGGESRAETFGMGKYEYDRGSDGRVLSSSFGSGAEMIFTGVGFRWEIDLTGVAWIGGRSCFCAMGNDSVKCIGVLRGAGKLCSGGGGEVRAGGGMRGILNLVSGSSFSASSSEMPSSLGFDDDDRTGPSGMPRNPGDGGPATGFGV